MPIRVRSFAKINLGLTIGAKRADGFHELRTIYQTIGPHDVIKLDVGRGSGIEVRSKDANVPTDESNTCYRVADRVLRALKLRGKVAITIEKNLPTQGGLGGASSNAVAVLLGMERALKQQLPGEERLRIAAEVGSDVPLFLVGGTVLGTGRGEEVWALDDLPAFYCVIATPNIGVSTPDAFRDWDRRAAAEGLTDEDISDRINEFSHTVFAWLSGSTTGVSSKTGDRAEALLLDLVRAGIENDFEQVVFPQHPELRDVKRTLYGTRSDAPVYASLSGSGSTVYGLFASRKAADEAARRLAEQRVPAQVTRTLPRRDYWRQMFD
jgi:4-diphosphocytidyl-2-C-methyl-D-erythritol kinase